MTRTIRRPATWQEEPTLKPAPWNSAAVREGDTIYVRTYAGPIVQLRVKEVRYSSFVGTVLPEDNERTYLAGCERVDDGQISVFPPSRKVTKKEYEEEDWRQWIVRTESRKKVQNRDVH